MNPALAQILRTSQIMVGALLLGVVGFTAVAMLIGPMQSPPVTAPTPVGPFGSINPMLIALGALVVGQFPVLIFLGVAVGKQAAGMAARLAGEPETRDRSLARLWMNATILRAALAEGAGLFGAVVLLLRGEPLALIGVGFAVFVLMAILPTRGKLENWIQRATHAAALAPSREHERR